MKETAVLIFSGYNQRAVIAFCRVLSKYDIRFAIIASGKDDSIYRSGYAKQVIAERGLGDLEREDLIVQIRRAQAHIKADAYYIAPSTEALNRFLLSNRDAFTAMDCIVPLVNQETYELVSDKYRFTTLCREQGILIPAFIDKADTFPLVAKPNIYMSAAQKVALSPVIIANESEYAEFLLNNDASEFFFQQYVGGQSFYLMYYFSPNGGVLSYSQQNLVQQPGGKSIVAAESSSIHQQAISSDFVRLFSALEYFGVVMVEVKLYQGNYYLIEANPRFWGPSQLFVDAGCRFFEAYLADYGVLCPAGNIDNRAGCENVRYLWYGGIKQTLDEQAGLDFHDCDATEFMKQLPEWLAADVYKRKDTLSLFEHELQNSP